MTKQKIIACLIVVVLVVVGVITYNHFKKSAVGERQAVFLTNGQVYFGDIAKQDSQYVVLTGVYYLQQSQQQLQNGQSSDKTVSLIKLGQELHGPEDIMYISRNQVLFYENIRNDSKVSQAIQDYLDSKK